MEPHKNIVPASTGMSMTGITFACAIKIAATAAMGETAKRLALVGVVGLICGGLAACSSMPIQMQCSEIQARIDYGDLTGDQLRFAMQELDDCRGRQKSAEQKDSGFVDNTEKRFTPKEEPTADSGGVSDSGRIPDSSKMRGGK